MKRDGYIVIGYARCSKDQQSLDRQLDALRAYGVDADNIYKEKITGTLKSRPELDKLCMVARAGDTVVIESLSRLGRSTKNLLELLSEFETKGIVLVSLKENIDLGTPTGALLVTVLLAISQFERDLIVQRTSEGLASARARGKVGGRPATPEKKTKQAVALYRSGEYTVSQVCTLAGVSRGTLYKALDAAKEQTEPKDKDHKNNEALCGVAS